MVLCARLAKLAICLVLIESQHVVIISGCDMLYGRIDTSLRRNDKRSTVLAWTAASDTHTTTTDIAANKHASSVRPANQSKLSVTGHDARQPNTRGQHVFNVHWQSISTLVKPTKDLSLVA